MLLSKSSDAGVGFTTGSSSFDWFGLTALRLTVITHRVESRYDASVLLLLQMLLLLEFVFPLLLSSNDSHTCFGGGGSGGVFVSSHPGSMFSAFFK